MTVHLDWEKDLEDRGWPRRQSDDLPPGGARRRWPRWIPLVLVALVAGVGLALWRLHEEGLSAARADIQEAVAFGHWALQQGALELLEEHLDPGDDRWQAAVLADLPNLTERARDSDPPTVAQIRLGESLAEVTLRYPANDDRQSVQVRRWFRLEAGEWRWTRPRPDDWAPDQVTPLPHLVLTHAQADSPITGPILGQLDAYTAGLCRRYDLAEGDCRFHMAWLLVGADGLPPALRDQALPTLAAAQADDMDGAVHMLGVDQEAWRSQSLRQYLASFHAGPSFVARSQVTVLRPEGAAELPGSTLGEPGHPITLPTPWLDGVTDEGLPTARWQALAERALADAVLRRASGPILAHRRTLNAVWALHMALAAIESSPPTSQELAAPGPAVVVPIPPVAIPDLNGLGYALQTNPDPVAAEQLAGLAAFLETGWSQQERASLARTMGQQAEIGDLLLASLGVDEAEFLRAWRAGERSKPGAPAAVALAGLQEHMTREVWHWASSRPRASSELYTPQGHAWRESVILDLFFSPIAASTLWSVEILDFGTIDEAVWVVLVESDGSREVRDLRFYRWQPEEGWLRDRPHPGFWGTENVLAGDLATWHFGEIDQAPVLALAPFADDLVRHLQAAFVLPAEPVSITVAADTALNRDPLTERGVIVPSPQYFEVSPVEDAALASLRSNLALLLSYREMMHKGDVLGQAGGETPWLPLQAILRAELEAWDVPLAIALFSSGDAPLAQAVLSGRLPDLPALFVPDPLPEFSTEQAAQEAFAIYVVQVYDNRWNEVLLAQGLEAAAQAILDAQGWTMDQLQAGWHRFLLDRFEPQRSLFQGEST